MTKILGISGSPVKGSSTDIILEKLAGEIASNLPEEARPEIRLVRLNELKFIGCQACGEAPDTEFCFYDDLNDAYKLLEECDCLLFGSPVYFDSVSAQAKLFIDRCNCFRPANFNRAEGEKWFIKRLSRKRPGAIILVGGKEGWFEGARRVVAGFFKWVEVVNEGVIMYASPELNRKGTVVEDEVCLRKISQMGRHLADAIMKAQVTDD